MSDAGTALMGIGTASGENRAVQAATQAINSPLLEVSINGARGVLFAISGNDDLTMHEVNEAAKVITESIDKDAKVIFGTTHDDRMKKGDLKVTVIATGFAGETPKPRARIEMKEAPAPMREAPVQQQQTPEEKRETTPAPSDYIKKQPEKIIIDDDFEEGGDDWSAVPAFLRRPKK
jgi:cell division protein FtsZ